MGTLRDFAEVREGLPFTARARDAGCRLRLVPPAETGAVYTRPAWVGTTTLPTAGSPGAPSGEGQGRQASSNAFLPQSQILGVRRGLHWETLSCL